MTSAKKNVLFAFLDERLITNTSNGGTRDWLCPSRCLAEKVYWKEIIPNQLYQRYTGTSTTMLLLNQKLYQLCDLIRLSDTPRKISLTLEGIVACDTRVTTKPHKSFYFSSRKMNINDDVLKEINNIIRGTSPHKIADVVTDVFETNLNQDFIYQSDWSCLEVTAAKIHFEN